MLFSIKDAKCSNSTIIPKLYTPTGNSQLFQSEVKQVAIERIYITGAPNCVMNLKFSLQGSLIVPVELQIPVILRTCPAGFKTIEGLTCEKCTGLMYGTLDNATSCFTCPLHAICSGNSVISSANYYSYLQGSTSQYRILSCINPYCKSGNNCGDQRAGPMCGSCLPGYTEWAEHCVKCPPVNEPNGIAIFLYILQLYASVVYQHLTCQFS